MELSWIKILQTAYPLGLNDDILHYGIISDQLLPQIVGSNPYFGHMITRNKIEAMGLEVGDVKLRSYVLSTQSIITI